MHFYVENLRISNFLSFYGEYKVNLKPYTAIMCTYDEGKADFLKALEFVFDAVVRDNPMNLVPSALREEFLINSKIESYVEVTVYLAEYEERVSFRKRIKNGRIVPSLEHFVSGILTSQDFYEEKLNFFNLNIQRCNLIFDKTLFNSCVWGSSNDLETTIVKCLRKEYLNDDLRKAQENVQYWSKVAAKVYERNYKEVNMTYRIVDEFANNFRVVLANRRTLKEKTIKKMVESSEENGGILPVKRTSDSFDEWTTSATEKKLSEILDLENKSDNLLDKFFKLKLDAAVLMGRLYYMEVKLATKSLDSNILNNRIIQLEKGIWQKEEKLAEISKNFYEINSDLESISLKISENLLQQNENRIMLHLQSRLTAYGRFVDYIRPGRFFHLLKKLVGNEIFFAHLCGTLEEAKNIVQLLKALKYEYRETFIIFDHYTHHLKNLLTASGEEGIGFNNVEDLLIFLCKASLYKLIDDVPIIVQKSFDFDGIMPPPNLYVFYVENDLYLENCGLISYKVINDTFCMETQIDLEKNLIELTKAEEIKYQELRELICQLYEIRSDIDALENDLCYFKHQWKKATSRLEPSQDDPPSLGHICDESLKIFNQKEENGKNICEAERDLFDESFFSDESESNIILNEVENGSLNLLEKNLKQVLDETFKTQEEMEKCKVQLRSIYFTPINITKLKGNFTLTENIDKSKLFFEKVLLKLRKLAIEDEIEDFLGCKDWRKYLVKSIEEELRKVKKNLDDAKNSLESIENTRKQQVYPLIEHCSNHLYATFRDLIGNALPFIDFDFNNEDSLQLSLSLENHSILMDIKHFNKFLRFISTLSLFLVLSNFARIPMMVLDDLEDFFPLKNDTLEGIFESTLIKKLLIGNEDFHFHLLMRIGQYLSHWIEKNAFEKRTTIENKVKGPMQIIFFTTGDFIHSADHFIWIYCQKLPEQYRSEDCNTFFGIYEIDQSLPMPSLYVD